MEREEYYHVTEVLSPFAYRGIDPGVLEAAAIRGTRVHEMIHNYIKCIPEDVYDAELAPYLESFKDWFYSLGKAEVLVMEETYYHDELCLKGTVDAIFRTKDGFVLVDYKTSASENKTWPLQLSAYKCLHDRAVIESGNDFVTVDKLLVVQLAKDGSGPKVIEYGYDYEKFLECFHLYRYFNPKSVDKRNKKAAKKAAKI